MSDADFDLVIDAIEKDGDWNYDEEEFFLFGRDFCCCADLIIEVILTKSIHKLKRLLPLMPQYWGRPDEAKYDEELPDCVKDIDDCFIAALKTKNPEKIEILAEMIDLEEPLKVTMVVIRVVNYPHFLLPAGLRVSIPTTRG